MRAQPARPAPQSGAPFLAPPRSGAPLSSAAQPQPGPARRKARRILLCFTIGLVSLAAPAGAEPPQLGLPLDCQLGQSCVIEDYVDAKPGEGQSDYQCGIKSRDGHRGTDFALMSFEAMAQGVAVLAAAPGTVSATRDGLPDQPVTAATRDQIKGRECGNAVRIDHGQGWQTLYCHMRQGSVSVRKGDRVDAGQRLGLVGLSGLTNNPHLHFSVLKDGNVIDPFRPTAGETCGDRPQGQLWITAPLYDRADLATAGFSTAVPEFHEVRSGAARALQTTPNTPIVLYAHVFFAAPGDRLQLSASGPDGALFDTEIPLETPFVQLFRAHGRKAPPQGWPPGDYRGYVRLVRGDRVLATRHADIRVTAD